MERRAFENRVFDMVKRWIEDGYDPETVLVVDLKTRQPRLMSRGESEKENGLEVYELDELTTYDGGSSDAFEDFSNDGEMFEPDEDAIASMADDFFA